MRAAKAPAGYKTEVSVVVMFSTGAREFRYTTPMALSPAFHKSIKWATEDMRRLKTPGRSHLRDVTVKVWYVKGRY